MKNENQKTIQILLFAGLITAIIVPFSINSTLAEEQTNAIYDPVVVQYIENLISQPGKNTQEKIIDGETVTLITKTKQVTNDRYVVKTTTKIDGKKLMTETFRIVTNDDGTYKLINHNLGIRETFTDVSRGATGDGGGRSNPFGASINLYDREIGTPNTLRLHDNYSACATFNQGVFSATVKPNVIDVNWEGSPYYLHWCFVPHEFMHGDVQYGTDHYRLDGHADRRGFHAFINGHGGTTWYAVSVDFVYGRW